MINENDAWINKNFTLQDSEKFKVMVRVYEDTFVSKEYFANTIAVGRSTVFNWFQKEQASFNTKSKTKICKAFNLFDTVWTDGFTTQEAFEEALPEYEKVGSPPSVRENNILVQLTKSKKDENMTIENLSKKEIDALLETKLEKESAFFMFAFAKKLKNDKKIKKALKVLDWIEAKACSFKYTHENELRHLKAVLLSDEKIKNWDEAIHILRSLYHSRHYHLEEPEILTLLASNYKRKALETHNPKEEIDMQLMTSAICLYEDAYALKPDNGKYYDAINLAYLYNLVDAIEVEYADTKELKQRYRELLRLWRIDTSSWWEVSSNAEFLMLLGDVDLAKIKINNFLENHKVKPFELDTTLRQLKLYMHFTADTPAPEFLEHLTESRKYLNFRER